ncbi:MAG: hypothetical protein ABJF10_26055, partial [Chthoniobacter sp.]|uniref:hypothetical protein n=1 Tax=Chthoniobacter sp. TaxID=2510640 RepID=UPI0032AD2734
KLRLVLLILSVAMAASSLPAADKKGAPAPAELKIHPKVFSFIAGWLSDGESPIVTEINLDAVEASTNQFQTDEVKQENEWTRSPNSDGNGFLRYRITEHKGNHYKVVYQNNGGGSLTTSATIEFSVEKRDVRVDGKAKTMRVLRVLSIAGKP